VSRVLVRVAAVVALAVAASTIVGGAVAATADAPTIWTPTAGLPLQDLQQLRATYPHGSDHPGILDVKLKATRKDLSVSGSVLKGALPFEFNDMPDLATLDGPTLHVRPGDRIHVTFVNDLGLLDTGKQRPTNIHYHGLHVSPLGLSDNIFRTFDNGQTYQSVVDLPDHQPTGTYWYHVHLHGDSNGQVMGGLSGLLIIDGLGNLLPTGWRGVKQRQLALRDIQTLAPDGSLAPGDRIADQGNSAPNPRKPSTRLVNALYQPTFDMERHHYEMWRLANIGANAYYKLKLLPTGGTTPVKLAVIAEDGLPVWKVTQQDKLLMPPGKRFDVLVMVADAGTYTLSSRPYEAITGKPLPAASQTLATITVKPSSDPVTPAGPLPSSPGKVEDLAHDHVDRRHTFHFSYIDQPFTAQINHHTFTPNMTPAADPYVGTLEEWTLLNETLDDHPFHIHVNGFQVMSVNGNPYAAHGHQDIVNIPAQTTDADGTKHPGKVVIRQRFKTFPGWFVFHCHILQHEDAGMMATIQVRDRGDTRRPAPEGEGDDSHGGGH
jgi:FtsP/CotA-like multicopper oxidase with cupredoxin domain